MNIEVKITKVGVTPPPSSRRGRPRGTGKIQKIITNRVIPLLEMMPNPTEEGVVIGKQNKQSWVKYQYMFPQLRFHFEPLPDTCVKDSEWVRDADGTLNFVPSKWAPRWDVYITKVAPVDVELH